MKRILSFTIMVILVLSFLLPVISHGVDWLDLSINNQRPYWEDNVKINNGLIMVPVYDFAKTVGADANFDTNKLKEIFSYNGNEAEFRIDSNVAVLNGKNLSMGTPTKIINNRVYVPLEFFVKYLNFHLQIQDNKFGIYTITNNTIAYKVVAGDTLWKLSTAFGTTMTEIKALNNLTSDSLNIGQTILIKKTYNNTPIDGYVTGNATLKEANNWSSKDLGYIMSGNNISILGKTGEWYKVNTSKGQGYMYFTVVGMYQSISDKNPDSNYFNTNIQVDTSKDTVSYIDYKVVSGDNSWSIAEKFGLPSQEFLNANGFTSSTILKIGQIVKVPVHTIAKQSTDGNYGEVLDWFTQGQYAFPIGKTAQVTDLQTGISFNIKRTIGSGHADCETLTYNDTQKMKQVFGGLNWNRRAFILEVDGRRFAVSMTSMPHAGVDGVPFLQNVANRSDNYGYGPNYDSVAGNGMDGHFDLYFLNSIRHVDGKLDTSHQKLVSVAGGLR